MTAQFSDVGMMGKSCPPESDCLVELLTYQKMGLSELSVKLSGHPEAASAGWCVEISLGTREQPQVFLRSHSPRFLRWSLSVESEAH